MNIEDSILIVGGYGVVGQQLVHHLRQRHPELPIYLGGRSVEKGLELVSKFKDISVVEIDLNKSKPLQSFFARGLPKAVVAAVNDPHDHLLLEVVAKGIPFLDITRWTSKLESAISLIQNKTLTAPIIFSSSWMAGVVAIIASKIAGKFHSIESIAIDILYSLNDKAGPNSVEYMDRLAKPYSVTRGGKIIEVKPFSNSRKVEFPRGYSARTFSFDTPEQFTLPKTLGAASVNSHIAFDDTLSMYSLVGMVRLGIWKLISGANFTWLRHKILYNPGPGNSHEIMIQVNGTDAQSKPKRIKASIVDPRGQTHLTSIGALIQLERLINGNNELKMKNEISFPESLLSTDLGIETLESLGVKITFSES